MRSLLFIVCLLAVSSAQEDCFCVQQVQVNPDRTSPTVLTNAGDGSDRMFYGEQGGKVWVWRKDDDGEWREEDEPFFDLSQNITVDGEQGFLAMTFHPDHTENDLVYMYYSVTEEEIRYTLLVEYRVDADNRDKVDQSTGREVMRITQPFVNHNGGDLAWAEDYEGGDPDKRGYLYIAVGDGGAGGDPFNNALNPQSILGKLLRIDPLSGDADKAYGIPDDNPFVGNEAYLPEIYALGLRNPWRISLDKPTGNLFIGDVGQSRVEEIDIMVADTNEPRTGLNYGWAAYEGSTCYKNALCPDYDYEELEWPIYEYTHEDGQKSVTGGFVYRGCHNPGFVGEYFAADYMQGHMFRLSNNMDGTWDGRRVEACSDCSERNPAWSSEYSQYVQTFGMDEQGEVYFASNEGRTPGMAGLVYRLIDPDSYIDECAEM